MPLYVAPPASRFRFLESGSGCVGNLPKEIFRNVPFSPHGHGLHLRLLRVNKFGEKGILDIQGFGQVFDQGLEERHAAGCRGALGNIAKSLFYTPPVRDILENGNDTPLVALHIIKGITGDQEPPFQVGQPHFHHCG